MRGKSGKGNWSLKSKLALPALLFVLCLFCFLAGFFGSSLLSQDINDDRPRPRLLQSAGDGSEYDLMPSGENGDDSISSIPFQILSWRPRALYFPKFATAEQCQTVVNLARPNLKPSTLALRRGETEENTKGIRTRNIEFCKGAGLHFPFSLSLSIPSSSGVFVSASEDKSGTLDAIEEKIARATMLPKMHGEAFNVLRYEIGQKYNSHYDAFNPSEYGPQKSQRVASFLLYLTDVLEGGETMFPFENASNMDGSYDFQGCVGLKVKPRQGDGLLFYSVFPNGTIDPTSLHGSCPVIKGQKWVATKWIRDQVQDD